MYRYLCCIFKDEAFDLWQQRWGKLYPEGSPSKLVIDDICKNYYLVNLVDNDFVKGNCLWETLEKTVHLRERTSQSVPAEMVQWRRRNWTLLIHQECGLLLLIAFYKCNSFVNDILVCVASIPWLFMDADV